MCSHIRTHTYANTHTHSRPSTSHTPVNQGPNGNVRQGPGIFLSKLGKKGFRITHYHMIKYNACQLSHKCQQLWLLAMICFAWLFQGPKPRYSGNALALVMGAHKALFILIWSLTLVCIYQSPLSLSIFLPIIHVYLSISISHRPPPAAPTRRNLLSCLSFLIDFMSMR